MKKIILTILFFVSTEPVIAQNKSDTEKPTCELPALNIEPEFVASDGNLEQYIYKNLKYPKKAKRTKTTGLVKASFIIERDGTINNITILNSLPNGCDQAVINLIKRMPKWKPAMKNSQFVKFNYELVVKFEAKKF